VATFEPIAGETWRLLPDAEGRYEVSDQGRIRSLMAGCRAGTVPRRRPLLMTPYDNGRGYLVVNLRLTSGYRCQGVGELVLRAFVGPRPAPHFQAAHGNGQPYDNHLSNLRWATPKENDADKDAHGTRPRRLRRTIEGVESFRCTRCDTWLPRDRFRPLFPTRLTRCGVCSWCRSCERAAAPKRAGGHPRQIKTLPARARADLAGGLPL
jgi:NUMOD4 motif-containing protein